MFIHLIAVHYDSTGKRIIGFRILDSDSGQVKDVPYDNVYNVLKNKVATIEGMDVAGRSIKPTNGVFSRYTKLIGGKPYGGTPIVVLYRIGDVGYAVSDFNGNIKKVSEKVAISLAKTMGIANGKLVQRDDGTVFISAIQGQYKTIEFKENDKVKDKAGAHAGGQVNKQAAPANIQNAGSVKNVESSKEVKQDTSVKVDESKNKDEKKQENDEKKPENDGEKQKNEDKEQKEDRFKGRGLKDLIDERSKVGRIKGIPSPLEKIKEMDEVTGMTVEQKIAKAYLILKDTRKFYYAILISVNRVPTFEVQTMGVSVDTLYYNPDFVKKLTMEELIFVLIHEIMHLAMQHSLRRKNRDPYMWNVACDYFINKMICHEFKIPEMPGSEALIDPQGKSNYKIAMPRNVLFMSNIDIEKDAPELLYKELMENMQEMPMSDMSGMQGDEQSSGGGAGSMPMAGGGQQGDKMPQDGSGSDAGDEKSSKRGKGGAGSGGGGKDMDKDGEGGGGKGGKGRSKGDGEGEDTDQDGDNTKDNTGVRTTKLYKTSLKGRNIVIAQTEVEIDLVDDDKSAGMTDEQKDEATKGLLRRAMVLRDQMSKSAGDAPGYFELMIKKMLAPKVDWRKLLEHKLNWATKKITTYSAPDRRFLSRRIILPGPKKLDNDALRGVKIGVDTSGSMSAGELGVALAQIAQLLETYKAEAELLYWDTVVYKAVPFKDVKELVKIKPVGGGGTNVNCFFEYFERIEYKNGRKVPPSILIIFTDGEFFEPVKKRYAKYRDTIWVVYNNKDFKAPFGTVTSFKI